MRQIKVILGNKDEEGGWDWSFPLTVADLIDGGHIDTFDENTVIREFTGLLDKSGKEIYEGDIIRCYATDGSIVYDQEARWPNIYEEMWGKNAEWLCEVIGNVYENPELLKP